MSGHDPLTIAHERARAFMSEVVMAVRMTADDHAIMSKVTAMS